MVFLGVLNPEEDDALILLSQELGWVRYEPPFKDIYNTKSAQCVLWVVEKRSNSLHEWFQKVDNLLMLL